MIQRLALGILFQISLMGVLQAEPIRFTKEDGAAFQKQAVKALAILRGRVMHLRDLAIEASDGRLGASDRMFLNAESRQVKAEIERLINDSIFVDSFSQSYRYLKDGLDVVTLAHSDVANADLVKYLSVPAVQMSELGLLATRYIDTVISSENSGNLSINGVAIPSPVRSDDTLSSSASQNSAIAIAKVINAKSGQTKVSADVHNTIVSLGKFHPPAGFAGIFAGNDFLINGVQVTGANQTSTNAVIESINNIASQSGVKARLASGSTQIIELYTLDGRNISIESRNSDSALENFFDIRLEAYKEVVFAAPLKLRSAYPIHLSHHGYTYWNIPEELTIEPTGKENLSNISMESQDSASDALAVLDKALIQVNQFFVGLNLN